MLQHEIQCAADLPQLAELQAAAERVGCVVVGADWAGEEFVIRDKWDTEGKREATVYHSEDLDGFAPSLPEWGSAETALREAGFPNKRKQPKPTYRLETVAIDFSRTAPEKTPDGFERDLLEAVARVVAAHFPTAVAVRRGWGEDEVTVKVAGKKARAKMPSK